MIKRLHWYSSLRTKVLAFVVVLSLVGLALLAGVFLMMERKMISDFERKQINLIENFVYSTLRPVMLGGQATLMPYLLESYAHVAGLDNVEIVRTNGVEAFSDISTIEKVNKYIEVERFSRDFVKLPMQIIAADDPRLEKVLETESKLVIDEENADGAHHVKMFIPFKNDEPCHACHGDDHRIRGVMIASISMAEIEKNVSADLVEIIKYAIAAILLVTGAMFILFNRVVLAPVSDMVGQVNSIILSERYDSRIRVKSEDEIGDLAVVFNSFISAVEDYQIQQATEKDRLEEAVQEKTKELREKNRIIEDDLKMAERVQQRLLPARLPDVARLKFQARYTPCMYIGGDFYDIFPLPNNRTGVFMADATGHGVSAALVVSIVKTLLVGHSKSLHTPAQLVQEVNDFLARITPDDAFITLFYGIIDVESGEMIYCLAGHPTPLIHNYHDNAMGTLELGGGLVGAFEESSFDNFTYTLRPGDRLFIYTDGLIEAQNPDGKEFGEDHVASILRYEKELDVSRILDVITNKLMDHLGGSALADDVTLVTVDYERDKK